MHNSSSAKVFDFDWPLRDVDTLMDGAAQVGVGTVSRGMYASTFGYTSRRTCGFPSPFAAWAPPVTTLALQPADKVVAAVVRCLACRRGAAFVVVSLDLTAVGAVRARRHCDIIVDVHTYVDGSTYATAWRQQHTADERWRV